MHKNAKKVARSKNKKYPCIDPQAEEGFVASSLGKTTKMLDDSMTPSPHLLHISPRHVTTARGSTPVGLVRVVFPLGFHGISLKSLARLPSVFSIAGSQASLSLLAWTKDSIFCQSKEHTR